MPEENKNPYDLVDKNNQEKNDNNSQKESWVFVKKLIKGIAKIAWLPDPETWEPAKTTKNTTETNTPDTNKPTTEADTTLEQDIAKQENEKKQEEEKKKFSFDSVMSWVSGVMDKIEKKISEKTWVDFDAPLKKREEKLQKESEENKAETTQNTAETTVQEPTPENEVEKNNEEYLSENH